jgi:small ligand-binding sensory domain FIST
MNAGVGYASGGSAFDAGRGAAADALRGAGGGAPALVLAFCSAQHDAPSFLSGVRASVGPVAPVVGGSAIGIVTNDRLGYEGALGGVAVLGPGAQILGIATAGGVDADERDAGRRLGARLAAAPGARDAAALLLFYDSIRRPATPTAPPALNASRPLIAGLAEGLPGCPPVVGAGVLGDYAFGETWQFCGDGAGRQHAVGALLGPSLRPVVQVMHGCTPMDGVPHVLTRVEGDVIHEIDGRPAAERIDEVYGSREWRSQRPVNRLALGVPHGERHQVLGEDAYVNRLITGVLPDGKAVGLFEPDLDDGAEVVFMLRDPALMIDSARAGSEAAVARMRREGGRPRLALYIDCAGRAAAASRTATEEAAEVQAVMTREGVPLLGFYSGVEVAPVRGASRGLDWTGVLLLLGEA